MIVADTNVVSELMRVEPDPAVTAWAEVLEPGAVAITTITVEEVERGLGRLPAGRRRQTLTARWREILESYADDVLPYDVAAAQATAALLVTQERQGHAMSLADGQIAGICLARSCRLATRNTKDFAHVPGLTLIDPWST